MTARSLSLSEPVVEVDWLVSRLGQGDLVILDASWYLPDMAREGEAEFLQARIPGARFFDFDKRIADRESSLPHMLPSIELFEAEVRALGVNSSSTIVCYDGAGMFAAPRAWWMFKTFGHEAVAVLNGGMPAWQKAGGALDTGTPAAVLPGDFAARLDANRLADAQAVLGVIDSGTRPILDARPVPRFAGAAPEPRPGLRSGHMPGASNVPISEIVVQGHLLLPDDLRTMFAEKGVQPGVSAVTTCGSGVTASVLALALERAGFPAASVYDGSWAEWGSRPDLPIEAMMS